MYLRAKPLKVEPLATKLVQQILNHDRKAKYLIWKSDFKVRIKIGEIIPKTYKQTTEGRRKRFRLAFEEIIRPHGWERTRAYNIYEKIL
jgi:hypothetical protein